MDPARLRFLEDALEDNDVRDRYHAKVAVTETHWWFTGAIMRSGHGRFWVGTDSNGRDVVVLAHRFGYALEHGAAALRAAPVLRHSCDEALCQRPTHLEPATDNHENHLEWLLRRHRINSPLRDVRGRAGRARAIRAAILAESDVAAAIRLGMSELDRQQPRLF